MIENGKEGATPLMTTCPHRKVPVWFVTLTCVYGAILAVLTVLNRIGADRWWLGALNLYLPQVIWVAPGVLLTIFSLKVARHWVWVPLLCIVWVLGPIMGFCWRLPFIGSAGNLSVRVMTWNVKYGGNDKLTRLKLIRDIDCNMPDIVLLQDAGGLLSGVFGVFFRTWNVRSVGQYFIASRFPLREAEVRWISFQGEKHTCLRCQLDVGSNTITLYNVHFQTPRWGLNPFRAARKRPWYLPKAIEQLENNVEARFTQARTLRSLIQQERGPVIFAGDLNSPDASLVCATLRNAGLRDAFAEGGRGYGYTYGQTLLRNRMPWLRASWIRIDHIMISSHFLARRCWTGTGNAYDHRPVIADLVLISP
jgi:vancomycin resistance protein VanJ